MTAFRMPDGKTMRQYCIENNLSYVIAYHRCDALGMDPEEAVIEAGNPRPKNRKHYIKGVPLADFCRANGINYDYALNFYRRHQNKMNIEECADYWLEKYKKKEEQ